MKLVGETNFARMGKPLRPSRKFHKLVVKCQCATCGVEYKTSEAISLKYPKSELYCFHCRAKPRKSDQQEVTQAMNNLAIRKAALLKSKK